MINLKDSVEEWRTDVGKLYKNEVNLKFRFIMYEKTTMKLVIVAWNHKKKVKCFKHDEL